MFFGIMSIITLGLGFFKFKIPIALYGLQTNDPISLMGIILISLFILKGIVAFGLWTEKKWAVLLAIIDSFIGIIFCTYSTVVITNESTHSFPIRLEYFIIVPYIIWLFKIKKKWEFKE